MSHVSIINDWIIRILQLSGNGLLTVGFSNLFPFRECLLLVNLSGAGWVNIYFIKRISTLMDLI
jgi:hypothetical protein